jgi:energy-coupling factor transporter ATP-binding protein EcfA2
MSKLLKEIRFGEPDANVEYINSLRSKTPPLYLQAWSRPEVQDYDDFANGQKFIITGHKGTGKTAILRHMDHTAAHSGYRTEFVVFKNEIIREAELLQVDNPTVNGSIIDEENLKTSKFYYHAIKRVMVSLLISKLKSGDISSSDDKYESDLLTRLIGMGGKEALRSAFDSILNVVESVDINVEKATKGILKVDPSQLVKKANDDLLNRTVRLAKSQNAKVRLFFDEMHFAFRDKDTLRSDASLVRDTILAAQALNERFAEENIDVVVYLALRREFLDQPEIAQADIVHSVESYGSVVSWEHYPSTKSHPIFDFITLRFKAAIGPKFSKTKLMETYLRDIDPIDLLNYTWSKPRDIVRFFKAAQTIDGNTIVISPTKYKTILRLYSEQSWRECKSALAAFVPTDSITLLERGIKNVIPGQFDGSVKMSLKSFQAAMRPAFEEAKKYGVNYNIDDFTDILYIMGIFYFKYLDANGQEIFQQYHRGNRSPDQRGEVRIHPAIAKALG